MSRIAVVLFNLGGPDNPEAVRPFLFNLFADPAIIGLPAIARLPLAALISTTRARSARANYALMGGGSPLLPETEAQAAALQAALAQRSPGSEVGVFIAMRYWRPFSDETARQVAAFAPDEVVLLPLYPQFSTTTTASSLAAWRKAYRGPGRVRTICCYPALGGMIEAHVRRIEVAWTAAGAPGPVRLLFSAHGLPEVVVQRGDPYQVQIEATAKAIAARLGGAWDWRVCYQSRVGPLAWLGPDTRAEVEAAGREGLGVVIAPIAFVSEHVETLVELDHEYAEVGAAAGCPAYVRVPTLSVEAGFIEALAEMTEASIRRPGGVAPGSGFTCAAQWSKCPARAAGMNA
ncbi:MAG: ferrochelatase [Caulobacteraceae bacterium]|nr:ferrochelatase [Caulobacteraceae bacterium]